MKMYKEREPLEYRITRTDVEMAENIRNEKKHIESCLKAKKKRKKKKN